jgi:hypothetical protein
MSLPLLTPGRPPPALYVPRAAWSQQDPFDGKASDYRFNSATETNLVFHLARMTA